MGLAVPFANIAMGMVMSKAAPNELPILGRFPFAMSKIGKIGLVLLWVSGLVMVFTRWDGFATLPSTFHIKLTLVILLTIAIGYISWLEVKAKKGDMSAVAKIKQAAKVSFALGLAAVVFAVLTFN
jgi:uncharacterized membrane protein